MMKKSLRRKRWEVKEKRKKWKKTDDIYRRRKRQRKFESIIIIMVVIMNKTRKRQESPGDPREISRHSQAAPDAGSKAALRGGRGHRADAGR